MIAEGSRVSFVGNPTLGVVVGDIGKVVAAQGNASHVQWVTGARLGHIDFCANENLVVSNNKAVTGESVAEQMADSLAFGTIEVEGLRATYDEGGLPGVVSSLDETGHLSLLAEVAQEAMQLMVAGIRANPQVTAAISVLEPEDQDLAVEKIAQFLLGDSGGREDE